MPGKSKKGGGLEVGSAYKMKNSALHMGAKHGTPIQANYGAPTKDYSVEKGSHDHPHSPAKEGTEGKLTKIKTLKDGDKNTPETRKNTRYYIGTTPSDSTSYYTHKQNLMEIGKKYLASKKKNQ
tara:strand:+ start:311 stop:682 length:372 start_codon:yes stop_codon:yes gene_type:complete